VLQPDKKCYIENSIWVTIEAIPRKNAESIWVNYADLESIWRRTDGPEHNQFWEE